jgi:YVTN family beta-propeller protein
MSHDPTLQPQMSVDTDPRLGTDLAGYRLESVLGRGGMGVVYLATDLRLERRVALKLIAPELAADPRFRERFLRESRLAASLDHSHIVPVHAAGETDGQLWLAMRYVPGIDLRTLLERDGPLKPGRALELVFQVASALDAAHAIGLVHRDVKPANILVTQEGGEEHCYLADFGLARAAGVEAAPSGGAHLSGTVDYTAPEQIAAEATNQRADVYSLGCVLYECLAGQPPFRRPRPTATLFAHASEPPPSLHQRHPELPQTIDQVIATALAKEPGQRYQTCNELVQAARKALGLGGPRFTRGHLLTAGTGIVLALTVAIALPTVLLRRRAVEGTAPKSILPLDGDSLVRVDPSTGNVIGGIPVGSRPVGVAVGEEAVWVIDNGDPSLSQIDAGSGTVVRAASLERVGAPDFVAAGEGGVWMTFLYSSGLVRAGRWLWKFDPSTGSLSAVPTRRVVAVSVAVGHGSVWLATLAFDDALLRLDPVTGEELARIPAAGHPLVNDNEVWVVGGDEAAQVDPETNRISRTIRAEYPNSFFRPVSAALDDDALWVTNEADDSVSRIDLSSGQVTGSIRVGRIPRAIATGAGAAWVANTRDGTVTRIDPETLDVTTIAVGGTPEHIAVGEGAVWVAVTVP